MKKNVRKALCFVLVAFVALSSVSAAKKKKGNDPYKKIEKQKDPATNKVYDFKGMEVIISDWWTDPDRPAASKKEEEAIAWHNWTNNTYHMTVTQKAMASWGSNPQFVSNFCVSGGDENYAFIIDGRSASSGMKANLFYDLSKIKNVDYHNANKYDQGVVEKLKKGDSFYAFNWGKPEPKEGMFFNKRLLEEAGYSPDYPYDLQKEGKWTWETFEEMCKKLTRDTDNDGVIDMYALTTFSTTFSMGALSSNGAGYIGRDSNGKYYNIAGSDNAMEAWNWIAHMASTYQQPAPEDSTWDWFYSAFVNGEAVFLADEEYNAQPQGKFGGMADDFGFVCFPLGPSGDKVYKTTHNSNMIIIPSVYDDDRAAKIAKAIDLYLEPIPGYESPDAWKEDYYPVFRDPRAVDETLELMMATPNPRFDTIIAGLETGDIVWQVWGGWKTPQEAYDQCYNVWQGLIDDCNR